MSKAPAQWGRLLLLTAGISAALLWCHLPAALLLGPMIAGIICSLCGASLRVPRPCFLAAQAVIGAMIAGTLSPSVFGVLLADWPVVLGVLLATLGASGLAGWLLVRYSALPGATGAWGTSPGGASAMVAMAEDYGADVRLVAFMQYLRVLFVAGSAALVVGFTLGGGTQSAAAHIVWFPSLNGNFALTLLLIAAAGALGKVSRFPSGVMLLPMLAGAALQSGGWMQIALPEWLLALAYLAIGWSVGLRFSRPIFLLALKTLPQIVLSIVGMILLCALMAWGLTYALGMDYMTAYLATSPGGIDTVAIIAAGSRADMSFIMAMQTLRLFSILLAGPLLARFISRYAAPDGCREKLS
ncbi:AbrB family transcriptional regulator [Pluralibacter gergoviae]|uniref:AbrB family transcriptional regulator n=1 Tax=Pluralibacter gergoviae TaxID=61647 RepID=UPI0028812F43|nr:AbrB family transcriptional regulator [Pluralibacter gergoviae]ELK5593384.1 AbrB family transcriptional regulator [Pluralibacter gergoviae]MDU4434278.1 AbrB family transcriptional regulator [Pluralibacter gergoviae]